MKPLLVIMAHAGANDMVSKLFPFYERAGCDILGIGRIGSIWPSGPRLIGFRNEGQDCYNDGTSQLTRFIDTLDFVTSRRDVSPYTGFCIAEWDTVFFQPIGEWATKVPNGLEATLAGGRSDGFRASRYFHGPWRINDFTARSMIHVGRKLLAAGLTEQGFLDRWLGLMCDLYPIEFTPSPNYSRNSLDRPEYIDQARAAIKAGAWAVHGVKDQHMLAQLTEGL